MSEFTETCEEKAKEIDEYLDKHIGKLIKKGAVLLKFKLTVSQAPIIYTILENTGNYKVTRSTIQKLTPTVKINPNPDLK